MILEVIVDISNSEVDRTFDYEGDDMLIGSRVAVEFGKKRLIGFVIGTKETSEFAKLKRAEFLDCPIDAEQLDLMNFMRHKYNLRHIDVLRLFVPAKLREEKCPQSTRLFFELDNSKTFEQMQKLVGSRAKKQLEALDFLRDVGGDYSTVLCDMFGAGAIKGLRDKGILTENDRHDRCVPMKTLERVRKIVHLTSAQSAAVDSIANGEGVFLLHGVTGSGKTEIYESVIEHMLKLGKSAIMLVPEISLTPQMLGIFRARFGDKVALMHSRLNASERYDEWKRLRDGEASIAIGARSAVFAPLSNVGAIFIDEEHDSSYISVSNPRYDTKEIAIYRAKSNGAVLVLGSATPDIETYMRATDGDFKLLTLPDRISKFKLPEMEIVDMVSEFRSGNHGMFSVSLLDAIGEALEKKEQIMLFLNRRGFASYIRCKECGYIAKCEDCDISLTFHKSENELKCHYCGRRYHALTKCPTCGSLDIKQGKIGTEKIEEELQKFFPSSKILRMDNDTTSNKDSYFNILDKFEKHKADILVGTQMIAKGHDFPNVTLVGILEADTALYFSDYRASERTFQLVTQVAGRAGRAEKKGRVVLQTYSPKHYVFSYAKSYDYVGFWKKEINTRMVTKFPPYTKIVRVLVTSENEQEVVDVTRSIYKEIQVVQSQCGKFVYLGAQKSPITRISGQVRYQVLARILPDEFENIMCKIYEIVDKNKTKKGSCFLEINPQSMI